MARSFSEKEKGKSGVAISVIYSLIMNNRRLK